MALIPVPVSGAMGTRRDGPRTLDCLLDHPTAKRYACSNDNQQVVHSIAVGWAH
jgi:hypothetical protein